MCSVGGNSVGGVGGRDSGGECCVDCGVASDCIGSTYITGSCGGGDGGLTIHTAVADDYLFTGIKIEINNFFSETLSYKNLHIL